ncbi:MAG: hypothetical protein GF353_08755 [Candidatus Lokiarchaeota archaeon]|nr:hypothetical protein [Candidatus Lokiarchaeota archaeon]
MKEKGLLEIVREGNKKLYRILPKERIQNYFIDLKEKIENQVDKCLDIIEEIYNTEETGDIPFIGLMGFNSLQKYLYMLLDTAKENINMFIQVMHYNKSIVEVINSKESSVEIKLLFENQEDLDEIRNKIKNGTFYVLKNPIFERFQFFLQNLDKIGPKLLNIEIKNSFVLEKFKILGEKLPKVFGLVVIDSKTSMFKIPMPIELDMAILSTKDEVVNFHINGMNELLAASQKVDN